MVLLSFVRSIFDELLICGISCQLTLFAAMGGLCKVIMAFLGISIFSLDVWAQLFKVSLA